MKEGERFMKAIMNPIRLRIVQFLLLHEKGTPGEIIEELCDIPQASLYRHIKALADAGVIEVAGEKKIRGTIEKTYALNSRAVGDNSPENLKQIVNVLLLMVMAEFNSYLEKEGVDPVADKVGISTSVLLLSDEELDEMTGRIGEIFNDYLQNKPEKGRRERRFTFILSPGQE